MNKDSLRREAKELEAEVSKKAALLKSGEMTPAEFSDFMDKAEAHNTEISTTLKNYQRAAAFQTADVAEIEAPQEDRRPRDADDIRPMQAKELVARYAALKSSAAERVPGQSFYFDLDVKGRGFASGMKTQGVTGLQGENANGTTAGAALSGAGSQSSSASSYFLGGAGGYDITPQWIPGILELRWYENIISSLMPQFPTDGPVVSYVRETGWTNNAAATGEGTTMPTSTNAIARYTEQVGKVANIARVTDEEIQDSNYFWALVQKRAVMAVTRKEEVELLAGSGYPGVNGLLGRSTAFTAPQTVTALTSLVIPNQSNPGVGAGSDTIASVTPGRLVTGPTGSGNYPNGTEIVEGILAALTDIRVNHFFEPDAIVVNPLDWFVIRTMKDNNNQYMAGSMFGYDYGQRHEENPAIQATDVGLQLWGKKVASTPAIPQGLVLVGDFTDGTAVLRRGGLRTEIVNTNGYDFEQGMWTMRTYTRVGLAVFRPELFELISLANG